jgi:hypothetical protein
VRHVETIFTTPGKLTVIFVPFSRLPVTLAVPIPWPPSPSAFVGVGHVVRASSGNVHPALCAASGVLLPVLPLPFFSSDDRGVGHVECDPVEALANVRGTDRESRNIDRPPGVASSFQISSNSIEPSVPSLASNLLSHDDRGPDGCDEAMEVGPEVTGIVNSGAFSCDRERLARARSCPDRTIRRPSREV